MGKKKTDFLPQQLLQLLSKEGNKIYKYLVKIQLFGWMLNISECFIMKVKTKILLFKLHNYLRLTFVTFENVAHALILRLILSKHNMLFSFRERKRYFFFIYFMATDSRLKYESLKLFKYYLLFFYKIMRIHP